MTIPAEVYQFVARALGCSPSSLGEDSAFGSHERWDSLGHIQLLALIEEELDIEIDVYSAEQFADIASVAELMRS